MAARLGAEQSLKTVQRDAISGLESRFDRIEIRLSILDLMRFLNANRSPSRISAGRLSLENGPGRRFPVGRAARAWQIAAQLSGWREVFPHRLQKRGETRHVANGHVKSA
jgi:hypothetical protein